MLLSASLFESSETLRFVGETNLVCPTQSKLVHEKGRVATTGLGAMPGPEAESRAPASAEHCRVTGDGLTTATTRQVASFQITAFDGNGRPCNSGGDNFLVAVRGGCRIRALSLIHISEPTRPY